MVSEQSVVPSVYPLHGHLCLVTIVTHTTLGDRRGNLNFGIFSYCQMIHDTS